MNVLDLFSGIGGFSLGLERAGMRTVAFCEVDPYCRAVLAKHWPGVPCHGDVTTREFREGEAHIITGGFPCQDLSFAGKRAGLAGERSGLYRELMRALRLVRPRHAIVENVAALLGSGLDIVLGDMAESGFDTEWDCVPACAIGAPHERDRVWIVAHANNERCGEAGELQHRSIQVLAGGIEARAAARDAANAIEPGRLGRSEEGLRRQAGHVAPGGARPEDSIDMGGSGLPLNAHTSRLGRGPWRPWRPPDSFAGIRDQARRHAADPYGSRLAFREGITGEAWEKLPAAERDRIRNGGQSIWPDEPALSGVDDGIPDWLDRTKSTGNAVLPQIPEIIGRAIMNSKEQ